MGSSVQVKGLTGLGIQLESRGTMLVGVPSSVQSSVEVGINLPQCEIFICKVRFY